MKKLLLLTLVAVSCWGCSNNSENVECKPTQTIINDVTIATYVIDSCEYIGTVLHLHRDFLTHKGNCKFCAQRQKHDKAQVVTKMRKL